MKNACPDCKTKGRQGLVHMWMEEVTEGSLFVLVRSIAEKCNTMARPSFISSHSTILLLEAKC